MKAMLLAGGLSTRLYPLTKQVPKPLVPLVGEPNAGQVMRYLHTFGIDDVVMNVFYLADQIVAAFGDGSRYGVQLRYLHEKNLTGSAGAVKQMQAFFQDGTFVVVGCDGVTDSKLDELIAFHRERKAIATIGLLEAPVVDQFGVVVLDDAGRIQEFQEKPKPGTEKSHLVNTGIYVFEPEIFEYIPADQFSDFGNDVFPALLAAGQRFYGMHLSDAYWTDIGTLAEYRRATEDVLSGRLVLPGAPPIRIPASANIAESARVGPCVAIGERVSIAEGVVIEGPSVIGDDVHVAKNAAIRQSILFARASVGATSVVADSILGLGYVVGEDEWIQDAVMGYDAVPTPA